MKKIKIIFSMCLILLFCVGCGKKDDKDNPVYKYETGKSSVNIYYPDIRKVACDKEQYQLKQPDSATASIEELMTELVPFLKETYSYHTYMLNEDGNLSLEFVVSEEREKDYELLLSASVSKTLFQLESIKKITFDLVATDDTLLDSKAYSRGDFYFYDYDDDMELNKQDVTIFYANEAGDKLVSAGITINQDEVYSIPEEIIDWLERNSKIPKGSRVEEISFNSGTCYIRMNEAFMEPVDNIKSDIVIYSIVNSITSLEGIDAVLIFVDESDGNTYRGTVDISIPRRYNNEYVEK